MEVHGSKPTIFENNMGKLSYFGLKKGMHQFDQRTLPYRKWFRENAERPTDNTYDKASIKIIAPFLISADYLIEPI